MAIDARQLDAFSAVVFLGSIGRAAEHLNLTQPALSRTIRRLEERLGVPLFDRHANGASLTVFGAAFLPYAKRIEAEATNAVDELDALRGVRRGTLRVGTVASPGIMLLPSAIDRLLSESPDLRIEIVEGLDNVIEAALLERKIDVGIAGDIREGTDLLRIAEHEFEDHGVIVAAPSHPLAGDLSLTMSDLMHERWVLPPRGTRARSRFDEVVASLGLKAPPIAVETLSINMIKSLVGRSKFISWLPHPIIALEESARIIIPLPVPSMTSQRHFNIYRRRHGFFPLVARRFLEVLRDTPSNATL